MLRRTIAIAIAAIVPAMAHAQKTTKPDSATKTKPASATAAKTAPTKTPATKTAPTKTPATKAAPTKTPATRTAPATKTAATTPATKTASTKSAAASSGDAPWVGSSQGKTYYKAGCAGAKSLTAANMVSFKTEAEAKKAGYARSTAKGC